MKKNGIYWELCGGSSGSILTYDTFPYFSFIYGHSTGTGIPENAKICTARGCRFSRKIHECEPYREKPKCDHTVWGKTWKYKGLNGAVCGEEFLDMFCFCEVYVKKKMLNLCAIYSAKPWVLKNYFWCIVSGKKVAWKQRHGFWGNSSNILPFNKLKPNAVFVCDCCVENWQCEARKKTTYEFLQAHLRKLQCEHVWTLASSAPPLFEHLFEKKRNRIT